jgi:hypothetical protein
VIVLTQSPAVSDGGGGQVEVEIAPEFTGGDADMIQECFGNTFRQIFPFDFILTELENPGDTSNCPVLNIFNQEMEACFLVAIYQQVRPAVLIGLFFIAITTL